MFVSSREQCRPVNVKQMKSTLKIDYSSRNNGGKPVIKIVQPIEIFNDSNPTDDTDPRDVMIRAFIKNQYGPNVKDFFVVASHYLYPHENPTHAITNIESVREEDFLTNIQFLLNNKYVYKGVPMPTETLETNVQTKIREFFEWLNTLEF